jgi:hypothetical protein
MSFLKTFDETFGMVSFFPSLLPVPSGNILIFHEQNDRLA